MKVADTGSFFLDPSVTHWDDKKRSTGMTAVPRHTAIHSRYLLT
ncbi:hypothetical protein [Wolbachia endosymbiont (group A) of Myopa testacea]